eukprot:712773-Prorocentrum_minimum.AAC.2
MSVSSRLSVSDGEWAGILTRAIVCWSGVGWEDGTRGPLQGGGVRVGGVCGAGCRTELARLRVRKTDLPGLRARYSH